MDGDNNTADQPKPKPKRKQKRKPTPRMIKTAKLMVENGGNASKAMREAGYSEAIATNPQKITRSEAFASLLDSMGVTDQKLGEVLNGGLTATKTVILGSGEDAFADVVEDHATRHKYLETGLRLKGLGKEAAQTTVNFNNFSGDLKGKYGL